MTLNMPHLLEIDECVKVVVKFLNEKEKETTTIQENLGIYKLNFVNTTGSANVTITAPYNKLIFMVDKEKTLVTDEFSGVVFHDDEMYFTLIDKPNSQILVK